MPLYKKRHTSIKTTSFKSPLNTTSIFQSLQGDYKRLSEIKPKEKAISAGLTPKKHSTQKLSRAFSPHNDSLTCKSQSSDMNIPEADKSYMSFLQDHHFETTRQSTPLRQVKALPSTNTQAKFKEKTRDIKILSSSKKTQLSKSFVGKTSTQLKELSTTEEHTDGTSVLSEILSQGKIRDQDLTSEVMNHPEVKSLYINFVSEWATNNGQTSSNKKLKKGLTISSVDSDVKIRQKVIKRHKTVAYENKNSNKKISKSSFTITNGKKFKKIISNSKISNGSSESERSVLINEKLTNKKPIIKKKSCKESQLEQKKFDGKASNGIERMEWLMSIRNVGLYVYCDNCDKIRYLPFCKDPLDLPEKWYCHMNPDSNYNKCTDPNFDVPPDVEELLIQNKYNAGSIVWAKMDGYPWWPAMVEDDPDIEDYFWLEDHSSKPTWYHVSFFDKGEVTRAWIPVKDLKPYKTNADNPIFHCQKLNKYKNRVDVAMNQANEACQLELKDRLKKFNFIYRYKPLKKTRSKASDNEEKKYKRIKISEKERSKNEQKLTEKPRNETKGNQTRFSKASDKTKVKQRNISKKTVDETKGNQTNNLSENGDSPNENSPEIAKVTELPKPDYNKTKQIGKNAKCIQLVSNLSLTLSELSDLVDEVKDIEQTLLSQEFGIDDNLEESLLY